ncbi:MAG: hypothetical protein IJZ30_02795 [Alphaproteobacteria bacterium]|nr:hypothetical protein [Alphaproteobacteria bacterium]
MTELRADKEKDFFERTLYNLELYEKNHSNKPDEYNYEVTMMLNSLLGLLVVLKERTSILNNVDISFLNYEDSTKNFFRHMRNSITHGHFIDNIKVNEETKEIEEITFIDKDPKTGDETFRCTLTMLHLRQLICNMKARQDS